MTGSDSRRVPHEQIDSVVKALYADADRVGWKHLSPQLRTGQYDQWVTQPAIGGVLTAYMSSENARSWIKDGPMKEYGRARLGAGRYAKFGSAQGPTAEQIVVHALGAGALVVEGSVGVKPFHCLASVKDYGWTYVAWGEAKNFRYLVWACLTYLADNPGHSASVVITETMANPTTALVKSRHVVIAGRCAIALKYYRAPSPKRMHEPGVVQ
jgi:hypothetical protein